MGGAVLSPGAELVQMSRDVSITTHGVGILGADTPSSLHTSISRFLDEDNLTLEASGVKLLRRTVLV